MKCIVIDEFGAADRLRVAEMPTPVCKPGDVLIRTAAAGVGPWDVKKRNGQLGDLPFPYVLGWEVAGVVEATGDGTSSVRPGDAVFTYCYPGGGYAGFTVSPESAVAPMPTSLGFPEAAAVPVTGLTAHQALTDVLGVQPRETVLIAGASGGAGTFAVQIAVALGARVIGTASATNHAYLRGLGASEVIDYRAADWAEQVRQLQPAGVDAVLDCVGASTLTATLPTVRDGGRVVTIVEPHPPTGPRGIRVSYLIGAPDGSRLALLARLFDTGRMRVEIQAELPLEQARIAHERIELGHTRGKIVLNVDDSLDL